MQGVFTCMSITASYASGCQVDLVHAQGGIVLPRPCP